MILARRFALVLLSFLALACTPEDILGWANQNGVALTPEQASSVATHLGRQREAEAIKLHPFLVCVRHHESDRGPYPHTRGYQAQNPISTASGAYQFLDSTWRGAANRAGYPGYARAKYAPPWIQDAVAYHVYRTGGKSAWNGSGC